MTLVSTLRDDVQTLLGDDAKLSDASVLVLIQHRYEELYETFHWAERLRGATISLTAQTSSSSSNTVTVTNGDATVTSAGSPFTATVAVAGYQIQIGDEPMYFFIKSRTDDSNLELGNAEGTEVTWPRDTDTAASWRIFRTIYTLPTDCEAITAISSANLDLTQRSRSEFDFLDPDRSDTDSEPQYWAYAGVNSSTVMEIEVWPVPSEARLLEVQYVRKAPTLATSDTLDVPVPPLFWGTLTDACHHLHAQQGSTETMWENKALFYERKYTETLKQFQLQHDSKRNLPDTLGRRRSRANLIGTDFDVDHQTELLG